MTVGSASRNWFASGAADSRGLLAAALDISADLIYVVDVATGRFVDVNQTTCAALGYTRNEPCLDGEGNARRVGARAEDPP